MVTGVGGRYRCVACEQLIHLTDDRRCELCGVSYASQAASAVVAADRSLATLSEQTATLAQRTAEWTAHREASLAQLRATIPAGWTPRDSLAAVDVEASDPFAFAEPEQTPVQHAAPMPAPAQAQAPLQAQLQAAAPAPVQTPPAHPGLERPRKAASAAMTAPALLGVSGSSLLIAASIVFVALTWTVVTPVERGLIVSAVAVVVTLIALWLKILGLTISSGAVGFVAMSFAGTATLAFSRGTDVLGGYDIPTAFLVACVAGLLLARWGIQWVGSAAALALAAAAVGYTVVATRGASAPPEPGAAASAIRGIWVWVSVGSVTATGLALTHRHWKSSVAKVAVQWVSVVWLSLVGAAASVWMWARAGIPVDAAFALLPILALAVLARRWPRLAVGPAVLLVTMLAPALVSTWEPGLWQQATAVAVAVAALLAWGPWAPAGVRLPLLVGVSPGYVTVALAAAVYSVTITVVRIVAGTYVPDTNMWAGVAALVAGLSIAQLRLWKLDSPWVKAASGVGAVMVVTGMGIVAFGVAEGWNRDYHSSVAVTVTLGAVLLLLVMRVWAYPQAAVLTGIGAWAFLLVAAGHSTWAVAVSEIPFAMALLLAVVPIALLIYRGRTRPWWGMVPAALFASLLAAAIAGRYDAATPWIVAAAVGIAAVVLWAGRSIPAAWRAPVAVGLLPALVAGLSASVITAADVLGRALWGVQSGELQLWIAPALVTAIALGGLARWPLPTGVLDGAGVAGALSVLLVAGAGAFDSAEYWGHGTPAAVSGFGVIASLGAVAFTALWRSRTAAWVNGVGATALLTVSGINAVLTLADSSASLGMPLGFACAAVAVLVVFGKWWPSVTLGPASFLITAVVAALVYRQGGGAPALAIAALVGAGVLWGTGGLPRHSRRALAYGLVPLAATAGVVILLVTGAALVQPFTWGSADVGQLDGWWAVLVVIAAILGLAERLRLHAGDGHAEGVRGGLALLAVVLMASVTTTVGVALRDMAPEDANADWMWLVGATGIGLIFAVALLWLARVAKDAWAGQGPARGIVRVGVVTWLTALGLTAAWATRSDAVLATVGAAATALVLTVLVVVAWRRPALAGSPAGLLATFAVFAALQERWGVEPAIFAVTALVTVMVWLLRRAQSRTQLAVAVGLVPAGVLGAMQTVAAIISSIAAYVASWQGESWVASTPTRWSYGALVLVAVALVAIPKIRARAGTVVLAVALAVVALLVPVVAALVLTVLAFTAVALGARARTRDDFAVIVATVALGWAVRSTLTLAVVFAVIAAMGVIAGRRSGEGRTPWGGPVATVAASAAVAAFVAGVGGTAVVIAPAATAAAVGMALALAPWRVARGAELAPWLVGAATILIPLVSPGLAPRGGALLVAGVAWFAVAIRGERSGRWWAASALSAGTMLIVAEAGVTHIEAYTAVPAIAALTLGVLWLREAPNVASLQALWPGLSLALIPSYIALANDPDSLPRTAALTLVIVGLAVVGVRLQWLAPILATAVTSVVISVLQIAVGSNMVLRMVSWIIVGSLLLAFASWFEKLKTLR